MTRHRGQKYLCEFAYNLCEFIDNLFLWKITSYNTFTTLLLGLRLSASFTWLLTKYVQLVCQTNHLSIYSHNFWLVDIKVVLQFTTCCLHVWLTAVFITHLRNTRLSIVWVQLTLWNIELLSHFLPTCYRFLWSIGFTKSQHSLRDLQKKKMAAETELERVIFTLPSLLCEMERHHLTDNINMCGLFARRGEEFVGLLRVCASLLAIKGGGRPTRLLPHAKMLLIPIKFFFSSVG